MKKTKRNILALAGVCGIVFGIALMITSATQTKYTLTALSAILVVGGLVLLAIAFGD